MKTLAKYSRTILSVLLILSAVCFFLPFVQNQVDENPAVSITGFELLSNADRIIIGGEEYSASGKGISFALEDGSTRSYVHFYALILLCIVLSLSGVLIDRNGKAKYAVCEAASLVALVLGLYLMRMLSMPFIVERSGAESYTLAASRIQSGLITLFILQAAVLAFSILCTITHTKYAPVPAKAPKRKMAYIARVAVLGAVSAVLYYFEVPIIPPIYKLDLSAVPALIAGFAMGPGASLGVMAVKDLIGLLHTTSLGVGELADFLMSGSMTAVAALIYRNRHTFKGALLSLSVGTITMGIVSALANYFIMIPFYVQVMNMSLETILTLIANTVPAVDSLWDMILLAVVPFNLLKGVVLSMVTMLLYKRISPLLKDM